MSSQRLHSFTIIMPFHFFIVVYVVIANTMVTARENHTLNYELHNSTRKIEKNVTLEDNVLIKMPIEETKQPAESLNSWGKKNSSSSNENAINIDNNDNSNSNTTESSERAVHGGNDDINDRLSEKAEKPKETDQGRPSNAFRRLLCEFLIFLVIAAIFCIISSCNCFCHKNKNNSTNSSSEEYEINLAEEANLKRLCKIEEPFAPGKPYCLRLDQQGNWHASPLAPELVPPLPSYGEACKMPTPSEQERTRILPI